MNIENTKILNFLAKNIEEDDNKYSNFNINIKMFRKLLTI